MLQNVAFHSLSISEIFGQTGWRILQRVAAHTGAAAGTWPVDPLVRASGAHARLDGAGEAEADVAEAAVPAPAHGALLVYGAILHDVTRHVTKLADQWMILPGMMRS
jgi:hypothetical protein